MSDHFTLLLKTQQRQPHYPQNKVQNLFNGCLIWFLATSLTPLPAPQSRSQQLLTITQPWLWVLPSWAFLFWYSLCLNSLLPVMFTTRSFPSLRFLPRALSSEKPSLTPYLKQFYHSFIAVQSQQLKCGNNLNVQ